MKTEKTPLLLSAFVYPGAGQFLQKRWIPATCYMTAFTIFMCILLFNVMKPMFQNMTTAMSWAATGSNENFTKISIPGIVGPFVLAMITYITNIWDTAKADLRPPPTPPELPPLP